MNNNNEKEPIENFSSGMVRHGITPFLGACINGNIDRVEQLLIEGQDINQTDRYGNTGLILSNHNFDMIKFLIEHKADPNILNMHGETVLQENLRDEYIDIAEYLICNGANCDNLDLSNLNPENQQRILEMIDSLSGMLKGGSNKNYLKKYKKYKMKYLNLKNNI